MSPFARDFWLRIGLPFLAMVTVGYWFAHKLIAIPNLQMFKVLNIIGLSFDLVGITCLSHFVLRKPSFQAFVIGPMAENVMLFLLAVPVGMMVCVHLGPGGPSQDLVENITYTTGIYIVFASSFFLGRFVVPSEELFSKDPEFRINFLGAFFLVGGLIAQLVAAVQDLYAK